jgi:hypothetical protein
MSSEQEAVNILNEEYKKIYQERMDTEMIDFIKMEEHWSKNDDHAIAAELWYLSLDSSGEFVPTINEEDHEGTTLSVKFKGSYPDVFDALNDSDAMAEIKNDACVGVITRSLALVNETQSVCCLTTLTTPSGVYMIGRSGEELHTSSTPKYEIVRGQSKLVDSLIEACFTW